jgi:pyruvate dehydrogenase E2 component (dihydrolipoamide acetyltransferase)
VTDLVLPFPISVTASPQGDVLKCWSSRATPQGGPARARARNRQGHHRSAVDAGRHVKDIRVKAGDKVKPGQAVMTIDEGAAGAPPEERPPTAEAPKAEAAANRAGRDSRAGTNGAKRVRREPERPRAAVVDIASGSDSRGRRPLPLRGPSTASRRPRRRCAGWPARSASTSPGHRHRSGRPHLRGRREGVRQAGDDQLRQPGQAAAVTGAGAPLQARAARFRQVGRGRAQADERRPPQDVRAPEQRVEHHPARHAVRQGGHHGAREMRKKYRARWRRLGGKLTVTAVPPKCWPARSRSFPQFNASVDMATARRSSTRSTSTSASRSTPSTACSCRWCATPTRRTCRELSVEIQQLAEKAKARKLSLDEMSGGSMSITNLGGIGGTAFTPIVNWPEVAILGYLARRGRSRSGTAAASSRGRCCRSRSATTTGDRRRRCHPVPALGGRSARATLYRCCAASALTRAWPLAPALGDQRRAASS